MKAGASGNLKSGGLSKRLASGTTGPGGGSTIGQVSKSRATGSNESGSNNAGRVNVLWYGKNVTPKDLRPTNPQKDGKVDGTDEFADGKLVAGEGAGPGQIPPPEGKLKREKPPSLGKEELDRPVDIILAETETVTLMSFPSICVSLELQSSAMVSARSKAYDELCASKADSDQYREQHAQTLNHDKKSKEVLAAPPLQEHVEVSANGWDIWDTFATDPVPKHEQIQQACDKESAATVALAVKKPGCLFDMTEPIMNPDTKDSPKAKKGTAGKSGPVSKMGVSLGGGASKALSPGQSGSLGAPASVAASQPAPEPAEDTAAVLPLEGAEADAAEKPADEEKAPADPIPWKLGSGTPIPEELSGALRVMERIVSQNVFHKQHMIYRNYPTLEELRLLELKNEDLSGMDAFDLTGAGRNSIQDTGSADGNEGYIGEDGAEGYPPEESEAMLKEDSGKASDRPSLQDLFCFEAAQLTQGMTVTCAEWNRTNQDLLAVSYGDTVPVPADDSGGLVLFWSLKNPTYPERVIRTREGVTALHFSSAHPNMVAAGTHDGAVMMWDLRRPSDQPALKSGSSISQHNDQKHTDIVWETRWVDRGPGMQPPETLVSVSSDGKVFQWAMKKGLEQSCLMTLKRIPNIHLGSNSVYGHKEGIVSRKSSGFCIDFPRHDPSTYLVGTEDGLVHRCSTSSNEQYLDTYYGHSGPVYKVRCNPFMSHAFLTCSADWTMRLWTTKPPQGHPGDTPLLEFKSTDLCDAVNDVIWAPQNSTSFAAAMDDGRVELWDLSEKPLDPIVTHYPKGFDHRRRRTTVRFSPNSPVLIAGDDRGSVEVMRMYNTNQNYYSDQEQQDRLNTVMVKKR